MSLLGRLLGDESEKREREEFVRESDMADHSTNVLPLVQKMRPNELRACRRSNALLLVCRADTFPSVGRLEKRIQQGSVALALGYWETPYYPLVRLTLGVGGTNVIGMFADIANESHRSTIDAILHGQNEPRDYAWVFNVSFFLHDAAGRKLLWCGRRSIKIHWMAFFGRSLDDGRDSRFPAMGRVVSSAATHLQAIPERDRSFDRVCDLFERKELPGMTMGFANEQAWGRR